MRRKAKELSRRRLWSRHVDDLTNEGYNLKQAATSFGNHFPLSGRRHIQRMGRLLYGLAIIAKLILMIEGAGTVQGLTFVNPLCAPMKKTMKRHSARLIELTGRKRA